DVVRISAAAAQALNDDARGGSVRIKHEAIWNIEDDRSDSGIATGCLVEDWAGQSCETAADCVCGNRAAASCSFHTTHHEGSAQRIAQAERRGDQLLAASIAALKVRIGSGSISDGCADVQFPRAQE